MIFFAKNILFLRKHKGWTQAEIPANIDISRATWSNYENSSTQPDFEKLVRIAKIFSIRIDDLLNIDLSKNTHLIGYVEGNFEREKFTPGQNNKRILYSLEDEYTEAKENHEAAIWYLLREVKAIRQDLDEIKARSTKEDQ